MLIVLAHSRVRARRHNSDFMFFAFTTFTEEGDLPRFLCLKSGRNLVKTLEFFLHFSDISVKVS